ncbi:putative bifunctional diguanylate cyclase/phosphodiesterase, partial [Tepidimonas sp.]|uniref:putative bifunctional diguanylate cyclase/phosphodiesterase n=1 Tax=Tepidimonas sp. TaxID=2002775 RepID=UPI0028CCF440
VATGPARAPSAGAAIAALSPGVSPVTLDRERYLARAFGLESLDGGVTTVLLRSVDDAVTPYQQLERFLGGIAILGVVLFALVNWLAMRRVTRPLRALTRAARAFERGDASVDLIGTERSDEVGALARGFETMRSSLARQQADIQRLAFEDPLTGLPNRARLRLALLQVLDGRSPSHPLTVLTLNLDRFKHINHVLGYAFGDTVLRAAAQRLRDVIDAPGALLARVGGDEFCVLVPGADADAAMALAERLAAAFQAPLVLDEQTVDLSAGMGVAVWPDDGADADTLLGRAEIAMRAAKARAEHCLRYDAALDAGSAQTLSLLSDLRQAVDRHELRLYLQPKIDVRTGAVVAAEALVRWHHPRRGLVPPMQFIPFAEQTGFVRALTRWMVEETARQWPGLQAASPGLRVAINLSTRDLMAPDLVEWLEAWQRRHGIDPAAVGLEITESAIMDDPQRAEATLNRLAAMGFRLSIDDFGTGYSSLAYLKRLPVQELKIDRSFVMGMERAADDAVIVRSTIDLAHNLGLSVVAEGVENAAILVALRDLGCDEAQGYHIARPMPVDDWAAWCRTWRSTGSPAAPPSDTLAA